MKPFLMLCTALALAGCNTDSQATRTVGGAAIGATAGAAIGAATGNNSGRRAAVGALAGGAAGALVGRATTPHNCVFRRPDGVLVQGPCP